MSKERHMRGSGGVRLALVALVATSCLWPGSGVRAQEAASQETEAQAPAQEPAFNAEDLPAVVARINGREVSREQLIDEAKGAYAQLGQLGVKRRFDAQFFREALDQIVAGLLLAMEAENLGLAATDEEVASRIAAMRSRLPSEEAFEKAVANEGLTLEEFERDLRQSISVDKYVAAQIAAQVTVSEEAQRSFYEENLDQMRGPEAIKVRHLLVEVPPDAAPEVKTQAQEKAQGLLKRIQEGEDFATLAREHSDDASKERGGDLPWFGRGQTLPAFEQAAFALKPGETSPVVETAVGFHIIQVTNYQAEGTHTFEQVKDRIQQLLMSRAVQAEMRARVEALRLKADIQIFI